MARMKKGRFAPDGVSCATSAVEIAVRAAHLKSTSKALIKSDTNTTNAAFTVM
jgi:hypothetical protein